VPAEMPGKDEDRTSQALSARAEGASRRVRVAALLLIAALVAGPVSTHVYWMLGGTWGAPYGRRPRRSGDDRDTR
jgi:hypothetical protein